LVVFTSDGTFHIILIDGTEYLRQHLPDVNRFSNFNKRN
jgi:hypothetical protein